MKTAETEVPEGSGVEVITACGGIVVLKPGTPKAMFNGNPVYFCLIECKTSFEDDPLNSCLAENISERSA